MPGFAPGSSVLGQRLHLFSCMSLKCLERALGFAGRFGLGRIGARSLLAAAVVEELDVVGVDFQPHVRLALRIGPRLRLGRTLNAKESS